MLYLLRLDQNLIAVSINSVRVAEAKEGRKDYRGGIIVNGHYFKCCIAESFVKVSILPYVGSVCYLSRQICFGSPDFSGADALIAAVGRIVSSSGNHNAAAATPVLYIVDL